MTKTPFDVFRSSDSRGVPDSSTITDDHWIYPVRSRHDQKPPNVSQREPDLLNVDPLVIYIPKGPGPSVARMSIQFDHSTREYVLRLTSGRPSEVRRYLDPNWVYTLIHNQASLLGAKGIATNGAFGRSGLLAVLLGTRTLRTELFRGVYKSGHHLFGKCHGHASLRMPCTARPMISRVPHPWHRPLASENSALCTLIPWKVSFPRKAMKKKLFR